MENYILSLIKENNRVIVPNFGAFIVAKENGFSVLFNNFLSFNDGLLVDYIVDKESISREESEKKVDEYVKKVKQDLDENGTYTIEGLGTFTKDATGILRFEQSSELSETSAAAESTSKEEESDDLLDIDNTNSEKQDIVEPTETPIAASSLNDTTPIAEFEEEATPKKEDVQESTAGAKVFEPSKDAKEETKEEKDPVAVANMYLDEDNSKRNRSIAVFLAIFIIPIVFLIVYLLFIKDNSPAKTQQQISEVKSEPVELKPAAGTIEAGPDTASQQQEEVAAIEEPQPVVEPVVNKPHQLIVGSFSNEINANKMIEKLQAKGYDQCFWFMHNNRYLVSLESFEKVYQAQARQEEILESERMESWIITKRN